MQIDMHGKQVFGSKEATSMEIAQKNSLQYKNGPKVVVPEQLLCQEALAANM